MTTLKTLALAVGLTASPMIAQVQQNPQPPFQPSQATIAACDEPATKPAPPTPAQNEAGRVGNRLFAKVLNKVGPAIAQRTNNGVQLGDIGQVTVETEAQKAREKQERAKYCAALKEAAKKAAAQPTTKVIEACPPASKRAIGTPYCLKPDNSLVDLLRITVPLNPPASSTTTLTPAPPASAVPATAQR